MHLCYVNTDKQKLAKMKNLNIHTIINRKGYDNTTFPASIRKTAAYQAGALKFLHRKYPIK